MLRPYDDTGYGFRYLSYHATYRSIRSRRWLGLLIP